MLVAASLMLDISDVSGSGERPFQFLNIAPTVKADQMGGAGLAVIFPVVSSSGYNPSTLRYVSGLQFGINYQDQGEGVGLFDLAATLPVGNKRGIRISYRTMIFGTLDSSSESTGGDYIAAEEKGKIEANATSFRIGYGQRLTKRVSVGFDGSWVQEKFLDSQKVSAFDGGAALLYASKNLTVGSVISYMSKTDWSGGCVRLGGGVSKGFSIVEKNDLLLALDGHWNGEKVSGNIGVSYMVGNWFFRLGYDTSDKLTPIRYGIGWLFNAFQADFSVKRNMFGKFIMNGGMTITL